MRNYLTPKQRLDLRMLAQCAAEQRCGALTFGIEESFVDQLVAAGTSGTFPREIEVIEQFEFPETIVIAQCSEKLSGVDGNQLFTKTAYKHTLFVASRRSNP